MTHSRSTAGRAVVMMLALVLALSGLTVVAGAAPAAAHHEPGTGNHFQCVEPRFFAQAEQPTGTVRLYEGSYTSDGNSSWDEISSYTAPNVFNALAFNPVDQFLYGVRYGTAGGSVQGSIVRIDADGEITQLGVTNPALGTAPSSLWDSGEFDADGNYYVASGNAGSAQGTIIRKISGLADVTSATSSPRPAVQSISLNPTQRYADLTFKDGFLWAINYAQSATLYRINVNGIPVNGTPQPAGTVNSFNVTGVVPTSSYGSAFTMTNGNLAFVATNNNMYQVSVTNPAAANPSFELVSVVGAPDNARSNATNCSTALPASLSVTKTGPERVVVGGTIEWDIVVTNDGPGISSGFVLTDSLPTGLSHITVDSNDSGCTINSAQNTITCNGGRLAVDETASVTVTATAPMTVGPIRNSVTVIGNEDPNPNEPTTADTEVVLATYVDVPTSVIDNGITTFNETSTEGGTIVRDGDTLTYTPPAGYSGYDSYTYETPTGTVTVNITVYPTADNDTSTTQPGAPVEIVVRSNDGGTGLSVTSVSDPSNGTTSINTDGNVVYTPNAGFSGEDTFEYTVTDPSGLEATATVTVTVRNDFTPGPAVDEGVDTPQNTPVEIELDNIVTPTGSPVDPSGTTVSEGPDNGTVTYDPNTGIVTYTPDPGFSGDDSFTLEVCDTSSPVQCEDVTITVTVGTNVVTASPDSAATPVNTAVNIDVLDNDTTQTGQALGSPSTVTAPTNGAVTIQGDGSFDYTPNPGFSGIDTFEYEICDTSSTPVCDTALVTVNVTPITGDDSTLIEANTPAVMTGGVLADLGIGSDLALDSVGSPVNGTVEIVDGNAVFTPTAGFSGTASFDYTLVDADGQEATGTITVTVTPTTGDNAVSTPVNTAVTVDGSDLTELGTGTGLVLDTVSNPTNGTVTITGGNAVFTPALGFSGTGSFEYTLIDDEGQDVSGTITVNVTPTTGDDAVTTPVDTPAIVEAGDLAELGTGTGLVLDSVGSPVNGTVAIVDGNAVFTPTAGFSGTASFDYTLVDAAGQQATGTITVNVAPATGDNAVTTPVDTPATVTGDTLVDLGTGSSLTLDSVGRPVNGSVAIVEGDAVFTPTPGFSGTGSFEYTLTDGEGQDVSGTITVNVTPTTGDDTVTTESNTAVTVTGDDLIDLGTGTDLTLTDVGDPVNGTVEIVDGNAVFTPTPGFSGTGSFEYTLTDGEGQEVTGTITVNVTNVFELGTAVVDGVTTPQNEDVRIPLTDVVTTTGAPVDPAAVTVDEDPSNGSLTIDPETGAVTYTPNPGFAGDDSFTIEVCDTSVPEQCGTITVSVTVLPNTVIADNDSRVTAVDTAVTIDVRANDDSESGQPLAHPVTSMTAAPAHGSVDVDSDGNVVYTPHTGFSGVDTFEYTVCDTSYPDVVCDTATVTITVTNAFTEGPAVTDGVDTPQNSPVVVELDDIVTSDGSPLDPETVEVVSEPGNGTVTVDLETGEVTYVPEPGYSGTDTFDVEVCDTSSPQQCTTVTINVTVEANTVTTLDDEITTSHGEPVVIDPLDNDTVGNGGAPLDPTSVTVAEGPTNGAATVNEDGTITYTPEAGFTGTDSFTYHVCDTSTPTPVCSAATVTVTVLPPVVDAPDTDDTAGTSDEPLSSTGVEGVAWMVALAAAALAIGAWLVALACRANRLKPARVTVR